MDKLFFKIIFPLWVLLIVVNLALPKKEFSESENRYLTRFPTFSAQALFNGKFMEKVDEYFNDHFVGRDSWITAQSEMEYMLGKRENNGVFLCNNALMSKLAVPNNEAVEANIKGIKTFAQRYSVPCYVMLVPSASAVQNDRLPEFAQSWNQPEFIDDVYNKLEGAAKPVPIYEALKEHKDEYIYYRTDHHWTTDGAFLAYQQFCKAANLKVRSAEELKSDTVSTSFLGTLSSKSGKRGITPDSIKTYQIGQIKGLSVFDGKKTTEYKSIYFDEYLSKKDKYSYFLGTNQPLVTIHTNSDTGKKLLIFKDSYSHSFAPLLAENYSEIALADLRYINDDISQIVDVKAFDDVLFLYSNDVFAQQKLPAKLQK